MSNRKDDLARYRNMVAANPAMKTQLDSFNRLSLNERIELLYHQNCSLGSLMQDFLQGRQVDLLEADVDSLN